MNSALEQAFTTRLIQLAPDLPEPEREYKFASALGRKWRFDVAWPECKVAVELEGGVYSGGRHTRGKGFEGDLLKLNQAALLGWRVLRFTSKMLDDDPAACIEQVRQLLTPETVDIC